MGIRVLAEFEHTSSSADPHRGNTVQILPENFSPEPPRYLCDGVFEKQDGLGCLRGVATALGIQALILILALAAWKLY